MYEILGAMRLLLPVLLVALVAPLTGCPTDDGGGFAAPTPTPAPIDPATLCEIPGETRCDGLDHQVCVEGRWFTQEECGPPTPQCDPVGGCAACVPESRFCVGDDEAWLCGEDGTTADLLDECGTGETCVAGNCWSACDLAETTNSYLGCRFLAVPTANILAPEFNSDFAVVIANASDDPAEVTVRLGAGTVASEVVPPGETVAVQLDLLPALQDGAFSRRVSGGAYEVTTSVPVAAYQYNPLHFEVDGIFSYTNDASLLLPEHVLTGNYRVSTWPTWAIGEFPGASQWLPGLVAIAATEDSTLVTITTTARTSGGDLPAMDVGDETVVSLDRGDVLQLLAEVPAASLTTNTCAERDGDQGTNDDGTQSCLDRTLGDLTGTLISADRPLAGFAGHVCTFVPFDRYACDHLEEMMFPLETWGRQAVMTAVHRPGAAGDLLAPTMYRVVSAADDNLVTFTPDVSPPVTLDAGEMAEFLGEGDFLVDGSGPLLVTQTMLGENALNSNSGDPALGSGIPVGQWRDEYDFLVPETYSSNWLNMVAPAGTRVFLDGVEIDSWVGIESTEFEVARLAVEAGAHTVESVGDVGFAITSYGYAAYTSYLHPGGMNFLR